MTSTSAPSAAPRLSPPGPAEVHDLAGVRADPLGFMTGLFDRYGDVTSHRVGAETVFSVHRPDLARRVLRDNGAAYTKKGTPDDLMLRPMLGNGLLTSTGPEWARQRRACAPAFRASEVRRFDHLVTGATEAMLRRWEPAIVSGAPLAVDGQLTSLTLAILVRSVLGVDIDGVGEGFGRAVDDVNAFIGHFTSAGPGTEPNARDRAAAERKAYDRAIAFLDAVTAMLIAGRRGSGEPGADLLSMMAGPGSQLTDTELHEQVLTLVMAGHETTAKALTWTFYLLDREPGAAAAVCEEVDRVLGGRVPTAADYPDLVQCTAAVKEAMRLFPPIWLISRRAVTDDVLDGWHVPAGTLVCLSQWVLHRDPRSWPEPLRFDPARFTGAATYPSHAYLPFGGGDRVCIGQHFALMEATLALATIASRVQLRLVPGTVVEPEALVTLRPRHGLPMTAVAR